MIKRLRTKFVLVFMVTVTILLLAIFCLICNTTRKEMRAASLAALQAAVFEPEHPQDREDPLDNGKPAFEQDVPPKEEPGGNKRGPMGSSPCFVLWLTPQGTLEAQGSDVYDLSDEQMLLQILSEAQETGQQTGVLHRWNLRYYRNEKGPQVYYSFMDISEQMQTLETLLISCVLIGFGALVVFFVVAVLLSRWLVKPVEEAFNAQRQFVADASHELKTPLTVILTNAELLQSGDYDSKTKQRFASSIHTMSTQMRGLVENLLQLARVDNGPTRMQMELLSFSELTEGCVLPFEPVYFEAGRTLESHISPNIHVQGVEQQLCQVVEILLDNGRKYSDVGTIVVLKLYPQGCGRWLLSVASQGAPLTQQQCKDIFKRFYRVDEVRSMNHSYGLGLPIAEGIVTRHKGKIWCQSKNGVNTFFVSLPTCNRKH